ncbi:hypothetical protein D9M70_527870 [compost metagenome]
MAGVEVQRLEVGLEVLQVGQLGLVEFLQQPVAGHDLDEAVRRHHHVIGATTGLEFGQQGLVAVVGVQGRLDAGVLLELLQQLRWEVVRPVGKVQGACGLGGTSQAGGEQYGERERCTTDHGQAPCWSKAGQRLRCPT